MVLAKPKEKIRMLQGQEWLLVYCSFYPRERVKPVGFPLKLNRMGLAVFMRHLECWEGNLVQNVQ